MGCIITRDGKEGASGMMAINVHCMGSGGTYVAIDIDIHEVAHLRFVYFTEYKLL